jgi:hypothetical protein
MYVWKGDPFIFGSRLAIWGLMYANPKPPIEHGEGGE